MEKGGGGCALEKGREGGRECLCCLESAAHEARIGFRPPRGGGGGVPAALKRGRAQAEPTGGSAERGKAPSGQKGWRRLEWARVP